LHACFSRLSLTPSSLPVSPLFLIPLLLARTPPNPSRLTLCDCPGLVFPTFASSKPDMVAAGVLPIDRMVDVEACCDVVCQRVPREAWAACYGARLPSPADHEDPDRKPTAAEVLRSLCLARAWLNGSGVPDVQRAGRVVLRDYVGGKLVHVAWPPGVPRPPEADTIQRGVTELIAAADKRRDTEAGGGQGTGRAAGGVGALDDDDLAAEMEAFGLGHDKGNDKNRRAAHKFQKKAARTKGTRGKGAYGIDQHSDTAGTGVAVGKRGGVVRVAGYI